MLMLANRKSIANYFFSVKFWNAKTDSSHHATLWPHSSFFIERSDEIYTQHSGKTVILNYYVN